MLRKLLLLAIGIVIVLAACGTQAARTVQAHAENAGETIKLHRGDQLAIVLEGNPTTGYSWEQTAGDTAILKSAGEPTFTPQSQAIGTGGMVSIPFVAARTGETTLRLLYHRTFEPDVPPLKTFILNIEVT